MSEKNKEKNSNDNEKPSVKNETTTTTTLNKVIKGKTPLITISKSSSSLSSSSTNDKNNNIKCKDAIEAQENLSLIPIELRKQGSQTNCLDVFVDSNCPCSTLDVIPKKTTATSINKPSVNFTDKRSLIPLERLNELRKKVQEAIKLHKVFTIRGCFYSIRKSLVQRGWVEKLDIHRRSAQNMPSNFMIEDLVQQLPARRPGESRRQHIAKCERNLMSRLLEYVAVDFLWTCRKEKSDWVDMARNPTLILNKFNKVPYTSKEGLCNTLKDFHWFYEEGTAELYFPRCYNVWNPEELNDFIENFRMTSCISLLRWLTETSKQKGGDPVSSSTGKVPITSINFAISRLNEFLLTCQHYDIDNEDVTVKIWEHDWDVFYTHHYLLTHENGRLLTTPLTPIEPVIASAEKILNEVKPYWPQYNFDGHLNIWIVKPGNRCRGRGIQVMNNLKDIIALVNPQIITKTRYVVQKYIERPLIIHNTKFDIRQWFLVTSVQPLVVWMYKESYLRFSSQEYNLKNHHESVHLTNHAVQKKYANCVRDERLPQENMWDCHTFQAYLRQIGQVRMWNERIYPGMQKAIVGTMLASQDSMDRRSHSFELFGADFMISEDFYPWLIEINSSPDLGATTSVTARLCPQCLEDIIKVVIDRRNNPNIDTGSFEMIYKQIIPPAPAYMGLNLFLKGQQIMPKVSRKEKYREELRVLRSSHNLYNKSKPVTPAHGPGPVVVDFMECLNMRSKSAVTGSTVGGVQGSITPRHNKKLNGAMELKKHNFPNAKTQSNRYLNIRSSINRVANKSDPLIERHSKQEFLRRHASCGPKYIQIQTEDAAILSPKETSDSKPVDKNLQCVGNKCLDKISPTATPSSLNAQSQSDWELSQSLINSSRSSSSSRKQSFENIYKSKSATILNSQLRNLRKTQTLNMMGGGSGVGGRGRKFIPINSSSEFNTYSNSMSSKLIQSKTSSNMFAVGLSLRAWRAKYNKIIKIQKENLTGATTINGNVRAPVTNSCPPSLGGIRNDSKGILKNSDVNNGTNSAAVAVNVENVVETTIADTKTVQSN